MITATTDLRDFDIYLYKFYVDDHNLVMDCSADAADRKHCL